MTLQLLLSEFPYISVYRTCTTVADVVCFQVARMRGAWIRRRQAEGVRRHLTAGEAVTAVAQRPYRRIQETVHRQVLQALKTTEYIFLLEMKQG
jgi:hypothetical protein